MDWKADSQLKPDQSSRPISQIAPLSQIAIPAFSDDDLLRVFGDGQSKARRLRSWGKANSYSPHFLATRSGTNMHTDPKYPRFSWHVILYNGGFRIRGLRDEELSPLTPGVMYQLDTHSPHEVVRDLRLPQLSNYKIQIAVDSDEPLDRAVAADLICGYIQGKNIIEMMANGDA